MRVDERAAAIERLYRERYLAFRNTVATITGDNDSARDVVQEAFARALRRRDSFRGSGSLDGWVWKIAIRAAWEQQRAHRPVCAVDAVEASLPNEGRDPVVAEALQRLSPRRRLVIFLRYFADLSYGEIADICNISEGTVAATLSQAHAELATALLSEEEARGRR